jgi:hypothetical protein
MIFETSRSRAFNTTSRIPSRLCAHEEHAHNTEVFNALMTSSPDTCIRL